MSKHRKPRTEPQPSYRATLIAMLAELKGLREDLARAGERPMCEQYVVPSVGDGGLAALAADAAQAQFRHPYTGAGGIGPAAPSGASVPG
jgi:hypothetical protein